MNTTAAPPSEYFFLFFSFTHRLLTFCWHGGLCSVYVFNSFRLRMWSVPEHKSEKSLRLAYGVLKVSQTKKRTYLIMKSTHFYSLICSRGKKHVDIFLTWAFVGCSTVLSTACWEIFNCVHHLISLKTWICISPACFCCFAIVVPLSRHFSVDNWCL